MDHNATEAVTPDPTVEAGNRRRIIRSAGIMSVMTSLSRIFGLIRDMLQAVLMGTGTSMDAYRVGSLIPNLLRRLLGEGAMTAAFIPTIAEVESTGDKEKLWRFVSTFFCTFSLILLIIAALGIAFSPYIVNLFLAEGGFELVPGKVELTIALNRIIFPYIALISIAAILMAVLNSLGSFGPSAFTPVLFNLALIVCGWSFASMFTSPAYGFAIGFLIGGAAQVLFQVPFLKKYGVKFSFRVSFSDPYVRKVFRLMVPGLFAVGITQINILITTNIQTGLQEGATSGIYYANRLTELAQGIFAVSIATVILPLLSRQAEARDFAGMKSTIGYSIRMVAFITIPAAVGLIVLNRPIVSILFERGRFDAESIALTAGPLIYFSAGLLFFSMIRILAPAYYALKQMKIPVLVSSLDMAVNVTLAIILSQYMGNAGIALALTCGAAVNVTVLLLIFVIRHGGLDFSSIFKGIALIAIAAAAMGIVCWLLMQATGLEIMRNGWLKISITLGIIAAGMVVYFVAGKMMRMQELEDVWSIIRGRKPRPKVSSE